MTEIRPYYCYLLAAVGSITYLLLTMKSVDLVFQDWVPDYNYRIFIKVVVFFLILFLVCRILDTMC